MQGWLFLDEEYWNVGRAAALLTSAAPRGKMLVLDLASTTRQAGTVAQTDTSFSHSFTSLTLLSSHPFLHKKTFLQFKTCPRVNATDVLGPEILLPMGCVKLGN